MPNGPKNILKGVIILVLLWTQSYNFILAVSRLFCLYGVCIMFEMT